MMSNYDEKVKGNRADGSEVIQDATKQKSQAELRAEVASLVNNSPSRHRARFNPDFTLTDEYERMVKAGESTIGYQRYGSFTDKVRQDLIDHTLSIPLSESVKMRDSLRAEIQSLEDRIDNFSEEPAQEKVNEITAQYKEKAKGLSRSARAGLQAEYEKECDRAEMDLYKKPKNNLKVERYEAVEKYKCYENRIKLYVATNKEAIQHRLDEARNREIDENLLSLAEYMEG